MPRTKGTKNRATLVKDIQAAGVVVPASLSYQELAALHAQVLAGSAPVAVTTDNTQDAALTQQADDIFKATSAKLNAAATAVGLAEVPARVTNALMGVYSKQTPEAMVEVAERVLGKLEIHILALKARNALPVVGASNG